MPTPMATFNQNANKESRSKLLRTFGLKDTPFMSMLQDGIATNSTHYFQMQELGTPVASNQQIEGGTQTHAAGDMTARTQGSNTVETPWKLFEATFNQDATDKPSIGRGKMSEYDAQKVLKQTELARDVDAALLSNNSSTAAAVSTAGVSRGLKNWFSGRNDIDAEAAGQPDNSLAKALFNRLSQMIYRDGGRPTKTFCGVISKDTIAGWVQNVTREVSNSGKALTHVVNRYENVTGVHDVILEPQLEILDPGTLFQCDMQYLVLAMMRDMTHTPKGITTNKHQGFIDLAYTLEVQAQDSGGMIRNLAIA